MVSILLKNDDNLIIKHRDRVMQRSKLVDEMRFLIEPIYNDIDMADCTILMEYLAPVSRKYRTEILERSAENYEWEGMEFYVYTVPIDTNITAEAGQVEIQLTGVRVSMTEDGEVKQQVRKTTTAELTVTPIAAWSDIIPDEALTALDQRLLKMDAQMKAMADMNEAEMASKADSLDFNADTNELKLMSGDKELDKVSLDAETKVVMFNDDGSGDSPDVPTPEYSDDVVQF